MLALFELLGGKAAIFGGCRSIEQDGANFGFLEFGKNGVAEVAKRGSDDDLLALGEAFAHDLQRGEKFRRPLRPRALRAFAHRDRVREILGMRAECSEAQIGDLHPNLSASVCCFGSGFFAADRRVCEVVAVDGELGSSRTDKDG